MDIIARIPRDLESERNRRNEAISFARIATQERASAMRDRALLFRMLQSRYGTSPEALSWIVARSDYLTAIHSQFVSSLIVGTLHLWEMIEMLEVDRV